MKKEKYCYLGVGGCGCNLLNDFAKLGVKGKKIGFSQKQPESEYAPIYSHFDAFLTEITPHYSYVVVGGLGGSTTVRKLPALFEHLTKNNLSYQAIFNMPWNFEGRLRGRRAAELLEVLEKYPNVHSFSQMKVYDELKHLPLDDYFHENAKRILEMVEV